MLSNEKEEDMERLSTLYSKGKWYKGNTHAHTSLSDGTWSPSELVAHYAERGYSFTALTDHRLYGIHEELNREGFLVLPGVELDMGLEGENGFCHHVVGLGLPGLNRLVHGQPIDCTKFTTAGQMMGYLLEKGNLCLYAHPNWSHIPQETLSGLQGMIGMEIFNNVCEVEFGCGHSDAWFDRLLWKSRKVWCLASDDTHQHHPDTGGGFIMVKAVELTHPAIIQAIVDGSFYASQGPLIEDFHVEGNEARIQCSACRSIGFLTDSHPGQAFTDVSGLLREAVFELRGTEKYIRAVCTDMHGMKAWTQPVWI